MTTTTMDAAVIMPGAQPQVNHPNPKKTVEIRKAPQTILLEFAKIHQNEAFQNL